MACAIYCLVPDPEQLGPLVEQLRAAGIATGDIAVISRRLWHETSHGTAPDSSPTAAPGTAPAPGANAPSPGPPSSCALDFWSLPYAPAALLWWQWIVGSPGGRAGDESARGNPSPPAGPPRSAGAKDGRRGIIPLAQYEAGFLKPKRVRGRK